MGIEFNPENSAFYDLGINVNKGTGKKANPDGALVISDGMKKLADRVRNFEIPDEAINLPETPTAAKNVKTPQKAKAAKNSAKSAKADSSQFPYKWNYDKIKKDFNLSDKKVKYLKLSEKIAAGSANGKEKAEFAKMQKEIDKKISKFKTTVKASNGLTYQQAQDIIQGIKSNHSGMYKGTGLWRGEKEALENAKAAINELGLKYGFISETKLENGQVLKHIVPESEWSALFVDAKL